MYHILEHDTQSWDKDNWWYVTNVIFFGWIYNKINIASNIHNPNRSDSQDQFLTSSYFIQNVFQSELEGCKLIVPKS